MWLEKSSNNKRKSEYEIIWKFFKICHETEEIRYDLIVKTSQKYYRVVKVYGRTSKAYIDFESTCNTIQKSEANPMTLPIHISRCCVLKGHRDGRVEFLDTTNFELQIDGI